MSGQYHHRVVIITTMNNELYESLGISPNEAKIYEALVEHGESGISNIAVFAKIHRRNAYDAIARLIAKGLCFEIISTKENLYNAVDPDKLVELLAEKQKELDKILPSLKKKFQHRLAPEEAYIYRGLEGQKNIWRDILRIGQDTYFIGAKGAWQDPRLDASRGAFYKEANKKKIKFIELFDQELKNQIGKFQKIWPHNLTYRFFSKEYSTSSAINIFGDYVVTHTGLAVGHLDENVVFFVIRSKKLADSYRTWFKFLWEKSDKGNT